MRCISRSIILLVNTVALACAADCIEIKSERISASDLGISRPARDILGFAPRPGVVRCDRGRPHHRLDRTLQAQGAVTFRSLTSPEGAGIRDLGLSRGAGDPATVIT